MELIFRIGIRGFCDLYKTGLGFRGVCSIDLHNGHFRATGGLYIIPDDIFHDIRPSSLAIYPRSTGVVPGWSSHLLVFIYRLRDPQAIPFLISLRVDFVAGWIGRLLWVKVERGMEEREKERGKKDWGGSQWADVYIYGFQLFL